MPYLGLLSLRVQFRCGDRVRAALLLFAIEGAAYETVHGAPGRGAGGISRNRLSGQQRPGERAW